MKIEYKNLPITVQTINVNGRKMSRQFLQQIPIREATFYKENSNELYKLRNVINSEISEQKEFNFLGEIIGWINLKIDKDDVIKEFMGIDYIANSDYIIILYITDADKKLKRTFVRRDLFKDEYPQIYI